MSGERVDIVELHAGVVHEPQQYSQVAQLANVAGLLGWQFSEADYGLEIVETPGAAPLPRIKIVYRRPDPPPRLVRAAASAWFLLQSLLAVRDGATDELLVECADALGLALAAAGMKLP